MFLTSWLWMSMVLSDLTLCLQTRLAGLAVENFDPVVAGRKGIGQGHVDFARESMAEFVLEKGEGQTVIGRESDVVAAFGQDLQLRFKRGAEFRQRGVGCRGAVGRDARVVFSVHEQQRQILKIRQTGFYLVVALTCAHQRNHSSEALRP